MTVPRGSAGRDHRRTPPAIDQRLVAEPEQQVPQGVRQANHLPTSPRPGQPTSKYAQIYSYHLLMTSLETQASPGNIPLQHPTKDLLTPPSPASTRYPLGPL